MSEETSDIIFDTPTLVSKWAPIIYGRTYAVDFRFLVIPHNFDDQLKNWLWEYIKVTTRAAENLPENPRWIFIRSKKRCVVGVTCMVRDLIGSQADNTLEDLTRDKVGRPLYAFVGYVSQDPMITTVPAMNLELFVEPYKQFVPQKWQEVYADLGRNQTAPQELKSEYDIEFSPEKFANKGLKEEQISIEQLLPNRQGQEVSPIILWNIANASNIWFTAANNHQFLSIALGNLSKRDLIDSRFLNAVINEVEGRTEETRVQSVSPQQLNPQIDRSPYTQSSPQYGNTQVHPSGEFGQSDINSQQVRDDTDQWPNWELDIMVNASKPTRKFLKEKIGERATNTVDLFMRNTWGLAVELMYGKETVEKIYEQIVDLDRNEYEIKLREIIHRIQDTIKKLRKKRKDLMTEGKETEAHEITRSIKHLQNNIADLKQELANIEPYFSRRTDQSTRLRQTEHRNPNFGFKEKEITENKQIDNETNTKNSLQAKDPWEL
ncbi:MAG: hypothetical protein KME46_25765 [Brasilonema angustatum HA4187-MV1]|jgi:hypothetical protein|nr:hypothetical protein [Brasilonema angustatum HA4187-MV1]